MRRQLIILSALIAGAVSVMAQPRCNADGTVTFQYKTGKEQQFTPGVMARLFPKPIISPEYTEQGIIFRFKAPEAQKVELECEILPENIALEVVLVAALVAASVETINMLTK